MILQWSSSRMILLTPNGPGAHTRKKKHHDLGWKPMVTWGILPFSSMLWNPRLWSCKYLSIYIFIYKDIYIYIHIQLHVYVQIYIIYIHIHIHIYIYTYPLGDVALTIKARLRDSWSSIGVWQRKMDQKRKNRQPPYFAVQPLYHHFCWFQHYLQH